MSVRLPRALVVALVIAGVLPLAAPLAPAHGAEYTMQTAATYVVEPDDRRARVSIDVTFTNTTPDPSGQFSLFPTVELAIHDAATEVAASDGEGELAVAAAVRDGVNVATVTLRDPLRFEQAATFTLTYTLPDGDTPQLRVRPSIVVLPVWSFGTAGTVRVELPAAYNVRADGDPLEATRDGATTVLASGDIADATLWLALVSADRETSFETSDARVELASGTLELEVRAFADDAAWGERARDLLVRALPLLEARIGIDASLSGPLAIVESAPVVEAPLRPGEEPEIRVGFDEPPFTLLHQAAHLWLDESLLSDRWSREGLASYVAGLVAAELEVPAPYDPVARRDEHAEQALPLAAWQEAAQDDYGYPASWAFFASLAADIGHESIADALAQIAAGRGAYDDPEPAASASGEAAGSRQLLDQLERSSGVELAARFVADVLGPDAQAEVDARATARDTYDELVAAAGEWGAPQPVRAAMEEWRFDEALALLDEAAGWLGERDALLAEATAAGLTTPTRLRDQYEQNGGGAAAQEEVKAEREVVTTYRAGITRASEERGLLARIGLAGGTSPDASLRIANSLFGEGDLRRATEEVVAAQERLAGATLAGVLRVVSALVAVAVIVGVIAVLLRRRRRSAEAP